MFSTLLHFGDYGWPFSCLEADTVLSAYKAHAQGKANCTALNKVGGKKNKQKELFVS